MPRNRHFNITAAAGNGRAEIRIDGDIDRWANSAASFRASIADLITSGVRDAHVYLNTRGGSVFEANEMVNEIKRFPGRLTGEGGALVASAGTFIASHLQDFGMPSNGMYMFHKGTWEIQGNEDQIASGLELLKKLTAQYRARYAQMMGKTEDEVEKMWAKGDVWLTAAEAKALGLIARITDEVELDEEDVEELAACGAPKDKLPKASARPDASKPATTPTMNIEAMRAALGMPATATEQEILARANSLRMGEDNAKAEKVAQRNADIKALVDKAIADKRITELHRKGFEAKFHVDFDATKAELEAIVPVATMAEVKTEQAPKAEGRDGWDFDKWMQKDEKGLNALMKSDPAAFQKLYEGKYGRKAELPSKW